MDENRSEAPVLNIIGERVALGPLRRDLLPLYNKWRNDFEVNVTLGPVRPTTWDMLEDWYERASKDNDAARAFTVYEYPTVRPVGITNLFNINYVHRRASFGIAIGEKDCWGKGYGAEAARLMLDYGFNILDLHNINLSVFSYNERGVRAFERAGFRRVGHRREAYRLGGRAIDITYMDCLATEFESPVLYRLLPDTSWGLPERTRGDMRKTA